MAERRINMNNKVENFEWHSLLDMSGKGLHKFNAVGKDMTCSQPYAKSLLYEIY